MANNPTKSTKHFSPKSDSFLEALRELGTSFSNNVSEDLVKKGSKDILDSFSPFRQTSEDFNHRENTIPEGINRGENLKTTEYVKREETLLFSREKNEMQRQVTVLQDEIVKLAKVTGEIAKEAQVTAMQEIPVVGKYHKNFFENLIKLIRNLRAQLQESSFWLSSWNSKSKKKNYWGQVKKSGTSFMLHHDRSVATQTG